VEKSKALVQRGIDPAVALRISGLLFVLAGIVGLALGALVDWRLVLAGGVCMIVALLYSGGPVPIARLPVGEIFAGGLLGLVLIVIAAFVQARSVDPRVVWLGLPSSTLIATILSVNNLCDVEGDAKAGRRTLAIVLGSTRAERLIHLQAAATLLPPSRWCRLACCRQARCYRSPWRRCSAEGVRRDASPRLLARDQSRLDGQHLTVFVAYTLAC
jgi:1,4-dihydroxy-2-naphthoate octaprenyltransferase